MNTAILYWNVDPEIVNVMGFSLRYYGVLFAAGIMISVFILRAMFSRENISTDKLDTLTIYGVIGIFLGARLGHCLFYDPAYYFSHPLEMLLPVQRTASGTYEFIGYQGLASHGGAAGLLAALLLYAKRTGEPILKTVDLIAVVAPLAGCFIRLGNLMNSEILGFPADVPWAFVFVRVDALPRHPAQLYEAGSYLLIFVLLLYLYSAKAAILRPGLLFGLAITLIFLARFIIEFAKEEQVPFEEGLILNMGQSLSIPFILMGLGFIIRAFHKDNRRTNAQQSVP